jgi:hypothetical protein
MRNALDSGSTAAFVPPVSDHERRCKYHQLEVPAARALEELARRSGTAGEGA